MVGIFGDKGNALQLGIRSLLFFFLYFMIGWVGVWYISGFRDRHLTIGELFGGNVHNNVFRDWLFIYVIW